MDLQRSVNYRGLNLNDISNDSATQPLGGYQLDRVIIGAVAGVGYTEKRSQADGRDSSDVYLDGRRFVLAGTAYGATRQYAHDRMQDLRAVFSPTGAYTAQPGAYGYLPLDWYEPTADTRFAQQPAFDNVRFRHLYALVRPLATPEFVIERDRSGGNTNYGSAFQFQAQLEARDPRLYIDPPVTLYPPDAAGSASGSWLNRGDYPSPLKCLFILDPHASNGVITINAGGSQMKISFPAQPAVQQIYRYDGQLKVLTLEENSIESLRMDLLSFTTELTHPLIPPDTSAWSFVSTLPIQAPSRMWFDEAYA